MQFHHMSESCANILSYHVAVAAVRAVNKKNSLSFQFHPNTIDFTFWWEPVDLRKQTDAHICAQGHQ